MNFILDAIFLKNKKWYNCYLKDGINLSFAQKHNNVRAQVLWKKMRRSFSDGRFRHSEQTDQAW